MWRKRIERLRRLDTIPKRKRSSRPRVKQDQLEEVNLSDYEEEKTVKINAKLD